MLRTACVASRRLVSNASVSAPVQVRTYATATNEKIETGYGSEVDSIINAVQFPRHRKLMLDKVQDFAKFEAKVRQAGKEVIPYTVAFPNSANPFNPPPVPTEPIPVKKIPTYAELIAKRGEEKK